MKFCYFIGQEFNAITFANWILFQSLNDLGPFPVACSRHGKYVVQLHPTRDFIYEVSVLGPLIDKFLGRRDQGSFSNEKRGTSLLSFKPIHKRNNTFLSFPVSIYKCWERHKSESSDVNNKLLSSTKFSSSPAAANESVFQAAISCRSSSRPSSMVISYGWWRREQEVTTRASISEEDQQETNATRIVSSTYYPVKLVVKIEQVMKHRCKLGYFVVVNFDLEGNESRVLLTPKSMLSREWTGYVHFETSILRWKKSEWTRP